MKLFLGIDGGQTATKAVIGHEHGQILGRGQGGPCNHLRHQAGRERFIKAIRQALDEALHQAALPAQETLFEVACGGFSGGPEDKQQLFCQLVPARRHLLVTDAEIALAGALGGEPGIVCIAGTGSIALGRNAAGKLGRAGGWGFIFGDEGSAFDLVRQALRAALRQEEGWGPATLLREKLLAATGASTANDLLHWFYGDDFPRERIASYAPLVEEAAAEGDAIAEEILSQAAQQLATLAAAVRSQLFEDTEIVKVSYVGGVFRSAHVFERFRQLVELNECNRLVAPQWRPDVGALLLAYSAAGLKPSIRLEGLE